MFLQLRSRACLDRALLLLLMLLIAYAALLISMGNTLNGQRRLLFSLVFLWCAYIAPRPSLHSLSWTRQDISFLLMYLVSLLCLFPLRTFTELVLVPTSIAILAVFGFNVGWKGVQKVILPVLSFSLFLNPQYLMMDTSVVPMVTGWSASIVHGILYYFGVNSVVKGSYLYSGFGAIEVAYLCSFMGLLPVSLAVVVAAIPSASKAQLFQMLIWSVVCNIGFSLARLTLLAVAVNHQFWFDLLHDRLKLVFQILIVVITLLPFAEVRKNFDLSLYFKRATAAV